MQQINHLPDMAELRLPETVSQDLYRQLLEPFENKASAMQFWKEAPSTIIILDPTDDIPDSEFQDQIDFALTYPEYTVPLSMSYMLSVAIVNDSGAAIYLLVPPQMSHLIND
jgi:hypothetical protein